MKKRPLTIEQILAWADAHHRRTGEWPNKRSGRIRGTKDENWLALEGCLYLGLRGLPGGLTLHKLLLKYRGEAARLRRPVLTIEQILAWADVHHQRTGRWPTSRSDHIHGTKAETWHAVAGCMYYGCRGLPRGLSLSKLLTKYRGPLVRLQHPVLTIEQILAWADAHHQRTGRWPTTRSGSVHGTKDEKWSAVASCLWNGKPVCRVDCHYAKCW